MKSANLIPNIRLNVDALLLKADSSSECTTMASSLSGLGYAVDKGRLMIIQDDGFIMRSIDDWRVIHAELGYILEEAERRRRA